MAIPEEEVVFHAARQILDSVERQNYIEKACADNRELKPRVEMLLRLFEDERSFLTGRLDGLRPANNTPSLLAPGTMIGPYRLIEQIGEGGMGTVYRAEQSEPLKRIVALKIIKPGMDTGRVIARFEAERQALALMEHPNIAKVYDAGTTNLGHPYFVMELIEGMPITDYCDQKQFTPQERLELFIPVCRAVQHAHQKGIIHRDLKPSNVLIATIDGRPAPKIIDFGVAKAVTAPGTNPQLTEAAASAEFGAVLGTLEYMSPEQAQPGEIDIDTRSDIYSLGVVLYELLTGTKPFERKRFHEGAVLEWLRIVREEEPPRPSTRLSTLDELPSIAANRSVEPKRLTRLFRGGMDWVIMKCLEKDRTRRYESAAGLARDIERFLGDEPVEASPPSAAYRVKKFVRRNRGAVLASSAMLLLLVAGTIGTTIGLVRTEQARRAEAERAEGERQAKESAEKRLAQIEKGIDVLNAVFENLDPRAEEKEARPLRALLGDRLVRAAEQLEGEAIGDPVAVARLQIRLGQSMMNLGLAEPAIRLLQKARQTLTSALGPEHADTLTSMNHMALAIKYTGKIKEALVLHEETLALRKKFLGDDHPDTLTSMNNLAAAYRDSSQVKLAIPLHESALALRKAKLGLDHVDTMISMNNLALSYHGDGKLDLGVPLYEETLKLRTAKLGRDHRSTVTSLNNLALGYRAIGRLTDALRLQEETFSLRKATLGHDHPDTLISMNNLANGLQQLGKTEEALPLGEECFKLCKTRLGGDHPDTLTALINLAISLQHAGQLDRSLQLFEESLALRTAKYGADDPRTLTALIGVAYALRVAGQQDRAIPMYEEALRLRRSKQGDNHPDTLHTMKNLALIYAETGNNDRASALFQEAALAVEKRAFQTELAPGIVIALISHLEKAKQFDQAETWRRKWSDVVKKKDGAESAEFASNLSGIGGNLIKQNKLTEAEAILRMCLALRLKIKPDDNSTFIAQSRLGTALASQKKFDEAEPLLLEGYNGLKKAETGPNPPDKEHIPETLERLVQLYDAQGKTPEADKWRKLLAPMQP